QPVACPGSQPRALRLSKSEASLALRLFVGTSLSSRRRGGGSAGKFRRSRAAGPGRRAGRGVGSGLRVVGIRLQQVLKAEVEHDDYSARVGPGRALLWRLPVEALRLALDHVGEDAVKLLPNLLADQLPHDVQGDDERLALGLAAQGGVGVL